MIITNCPYCNEPQNFIWKHNFPKGYFPSRCGSCDEVMWVEGAEYDGITYKHKDFLSMINEKLPYRDDLMFEIMKNEAIDHNIVGRDAGAI